MKGVQKMQRERKGGKEEKEIGKKKKKEERNLSITFQAYIISNFALNWKCSHKI